MLIATQFRTGIQLTKDPLCGLEAQPVMSLSMKYLLWAGVEPERRPKAVKANSGYDRKL